MPQVSPGATQHTEATQMSAQQSVVAVQGEPVKPQQVSSMQAIWGPQQSLVCSQSSPSVLHAVAVAQTPWLQTRLPVAPPLHCASVVQAH